MPGASKARTQAIHEAAMQVVDAVAIDSIEGAEDRRKALRAAADQLVAAVGCTLETARRHVAKAMRLKRHPNYTGPGGYVAAGWGGKRPGAGRPAGETEPGE